MSRLMSLFGIILAVAGLALIVLSVTDPGLMQVYGVTPEAGAILLVGGVLALGLGGVISAIEGNAIDDAEPVVKVAKVVAPSETKTTGLFGRKSAETAAVATSIATVAEAASAKSSSTSVAETISALEQAKSDIKTALGGMEDVTQGSEDLTPVPDAVEATPPVASAAGDAVEGEDDLYVVEEKIIRGRPSRILSDDTVEAETDEGWMRFENLEHLNEYLDSVEEGQA
jgi:hypothetical protein